MLLTFTNNNTRHYNEWETPTISTNQFSYNFLKWTDMNKVHKYHESSLGKWEVYNFSDPKIYSYIFFIFSYTLIDLSIREFLVSQETYFSGMIKLENKSPIQAHTSWSMITTFGKSNLYMKFVHDIIINDGQI